MVVLRTGAFVVVHRIIIIIIAPTPFWSLPFLSRHFIIAFRGTFCAVTRSRVVAAAAAATLEVSSTLDCDRCVVEGSSSWPRRRDGPCPDNDDDDNDDETKGGPSPVSMGWPTMTFGATRVSARVAAQTIDEEATLMVNPRDEATWELRAEEPVCLHYDFFGRISPNGTIIGVPKSHRDILEFEACESVYTEQ